MYSLKEEKASLKQTVQTVLLSYCLTFTTYCYHSLPGSPAPTAVRYFYHHERNEYNTHTLVITLSYACHTILKEHSIVSHGILIECSISCPIDVQ